MDAMGAITIIAVCGLGLGVAIVSTGEIRENTDNFLTIQSIKSSLRSSLRDPSTYTPTIRQQLSASLSNNGAGASNSLQNIVLSFKPNAGASEQGVAQPDIAIRTDGTLFYLKKDQTACAGFNDPDCFVQVQVNLRQLSTGVGASSIYLGYGFQITFQLNPSLGTSLDVMDANVSVRIPNEIFKSTTANQCSLINNQVAVRGVNRNTGVVDCIQAPPANWQCPAGTFAKGFRIQPGSPAPGVMVLNCVGQNEEIRCPDNYSLHWFLPASLVDGPKIGECIWTAQRTTTRRTYTGASIQGRACPPNYRLRPTSCTNPVEVSSTNGRCQRTCSGGVDCSVSYPATPGTTVPNIDYNTGDISCIVNAPQTADPGGCTVWEPPFWSGTTSIDVECELDPSIAETTAVAP